MTRWMRAHKDSASTTLIGDPACATMSISTISSKRATSASDEVRRPTALPAVSQADQVRQPVAAAEGVSCVPSAMRMRAPRAKRRASYCPKR